MIENIDICYTKINVKNTFYTVSKASPPLLHTAVVFWALAVPHLFKGHGFTPCLFLGIPFPFSFVKTTARAGHAMFH